MRYLRNDTSESCIDGFQNSVRVDYRMIDLFFDSHEKKLVAFVKRRHKNDITMTVDSVEIDNTSLSSFKNKICMWVV